MVAFSADRLLHEADAIDLEMELDKSKLRLADVRKNKRLQADNLVFSVTNEKLQGDELAIPYLDDGDLQLDPYEFIYAAVRPLLSH